MPKPIPSGHNRSLARVAYGSALLATGSLMLSAWLLLYGRGSCSDACDEAVQRTGELEELQHQVAELRRQASGPQRSVVASVTIPQLVRRMDQLESLVSEKAAGSDDDGTSSGGGESSNERAPDGSPRFVRLEVPYPSLAVRQSEGGALEVVNTDPSLTSQTLRIKGTTADGTVHEIVIVVPPPE